MVCSKCQSENPETAQFCNVCGNLLSSPLASPAPAPQQTESSQSSLPPEPEKPSKKNKFSKLMIIGAVGLAILVALFLIPAPKSWFPKNIGLFGGDESSIGETDTTGSEVEQGLGAEPGVAIEPTLSEYDRDTDGDGFPDFLEEGTGYNPAVVDCASEANCQGTVGGINPEKENNVLFILDSSGSMAGQAGGQQKMVAAKAAINSYIDRLPAGVNAGLMVYGHKGSNSEVDKAISCQGIELLYPIGMVDKAAFKAAVASFSPTGWTPIADSLTKAGGEAFRDKEGHNNSIILVSDGIETCGGNPCQVAADLKNAGIMMKVDVVGFDVDASARQQLQCIAQITGGQYHDVHNAVELNQAFDQFVKNTEEVVKIANCLAQNFFTYTSCLDRQIIASINYLDQERFKAQDAGNWEKDEQLGAVGARLSKKYDKFRSEFEEKYRKDIGDIVDQYDENLPEDLSGLDEADLEIYQQLGN